MNSEPSVTYKSRVSGVHDMECLYLSAHTHCLTLYQRRADYDGQFRSTSTHDGESKVKTKLVFDNVERFLLCLDAL